MPAVASIPKVTTCDGATQMPCPFAHALPGSTSNFSSDKGIVPASGVGEPAEKRTEAFPAHP